MACYYLVISSTHLSNGHFRSIKGVFRGPLHKTGTTLPGYAEKGKSIANALEDLKANFYCELCDKQYHKHQEFDNHINSYDHAHKQRLKELKQREFARNVASKSWKDEKKQEKALKRLHQLAELRKQPDCVAEEVPLFKAPRLKGPKEDLGIGKDENIASLRCPVMCSPETVTSSGSTEEKKPDILFDGEVLKESSCCFVGNQNQLQVPLSNSSSVNNRAGVSFCFSKKALLKLDSSASVFNESMDEVNEYKQFLHHKAKQMSVSFRHYAHLNESAAETSVLSQPDETDMSLPDNAPANAEKFKDDKGSQENSKEQSEIAQSNITAKRRSPDTSCTDQPSQKEVNVPSETEPISESTTEARCQTQSSIQETGSSKHTVADAILIEHFSNLLSQKHAEVGPSCKSNQENSEASNDPHENPRECAAPEPSLDEAVNTNTQAKALSFLSVLSKDGNTILQWPTELVLFTKTQPSISYACNPLYFDFKCSPKNKMRKPNERETGRCKDSDQPSRSYEDRASDINAERVVGSGMESPSLEPKKGVNQEPAENIDSYQTAMGFPLKAKNSYFNDDEPQLSTYFSHPRKCFSRESYHSRKRKRSSHSQFEGSKKSNHCTVNINCKEELKSRRFVPQERLRKDKSYSSKISLASRQEDIFSSVNNEGGKDSDSDTNSDISHKTSSSQLSYTGSSMSSGSSCRYRDLLSQESTQEASLNADSCRSAKHKNDMSSESDYINDDKNFNCKCKRHKHNTFSEVSRNEYLDHWFCSKHARNKRRSWKQHDDPEMDHVGGKCNFIQKSKSESFETVELRVNNSSASPENINYLLIPSRSPHKAGQSDNSVTRDFLQCHPQDVTPTLVNCRKSTSENIVEPKNDNEREQLVPSLNLEGKLALTQTVGDNNRTKECVVEFNEPLESSSPVKCTTVGSENVVVTLHDESKSSSNNVDLHSKNYMIGSVSSSPHNGSEDCEVTVMTNCDNNIFDNVIHIDTEDRIEVEEQKEHLISEGKPIMQSPDPVHLNFSCPLPSLRHPGGINSPDTKEEPLRLGRPDVNSKLSLVDGNLKCFYDSTMQDFRKMDNRLHHKSTGPPLAQQPVTFSPDEVDKYKILQIQAQQHMQKQLLTKHFKALPTNGSAVFSTAQTIQPMSIQHHPSITTFHHALMQRYAVTASMHSHVNHFPLPHLNNFPQSQFSPISLSSSFTPTLFPTPPQIIGHALAHPLHLVSAAAIHAPHLTIQAIPHATLIPTLFAPHPNTGMHPTLQLHSLIHPLFQGQEFHQHSGSNHLH
ncbi:zinc finger protein 804B [Rhinoderma darwinii]|uniref:zinc finger protein 804B n=1 Tax=Rhinoderma darwinii TaxID=43563 RepID=UPI003F671630